MQNEKPSPSLSRLHLRTTVLTFGLAVVLFASPALAYPGEQLLNFAANFIIGPLGLFSLVLFLAASQWRPEGTKQAVYSAVICAILFGIIKMAPQIMTAMRA